MFLCSTSVLQHGWMGCFFCCFVFVLVFNTLYPCLFLLHNFYILLHLHCKCRQNHMGIKLLVVFRGIVCLSFITLCQHFALTNMFPENTRTVFNKTLQKWVGLGRPSKIASVRVCSSNKMAFKELEQVFSTWLEYFDIFWNMLDFKITLKEILIEYPSVIHLSVFQYFQLTTTVMY